MGCNSSYSKKESSNDRYNDFLPVDKGNSWEYINEAPREETELFKVEITSVKKDGEDKIAVFSSFPFFSRTEEETILRVKKDGSVYAVNKNSQKEELFIPQTADLKKGYQWQFGEWTGIIGSTNETVKAENETFTDCVFLNFYISFTFSAEIWIAKDKGIVKWGYNRTNPPTPKILYYVINKMSLAK